MPTEYIKLLIQNYKILEKVFPSLSKIKELREKLEERTL